MTQQQGLAPIYFPTTVVFIDDDENFLDSLSLALPDDLAFRVYSQPRKALDHINEVTVDAPAASRCFSRRHDDKHGAEIVSVDLSSIEQTLYQEQRFSEVSVVFIDYDMPSINGLELCRHLKDVPVKKVLLTGKADEQVAIDAFNNGLIDHYIPKQQPDIVDYLRATILRLQQDYFHSASASLTHALPAHHANFLSDAAFVDHFNKLATQHGWVEHYLATTPPGLICLDADGEPSLLYVCNRRQLDHYAAAAHQQHAPTDLVRLISRGEMIPTAPLRGDASDWSRNVTLAQQVPDSDDWFVAVVAQPDQFKDAPGRFLDYRYYLEILEYMHLHPR